MTRTMRLSMTRRMSLTFLPFSRSLCNKGRTRIATSRLTFSACFGAESCTQHHKLTTFILCSYLNWCISKLPWRCMLVHAIKTTRHTQYIELACQRSNTPEACFRRLKSSRCSTARGADWLLSCKAEQVPICKQAQREIGHRRQAPTNGILQKLTSLESCRHS